MAIDKRVEREALQSMQREIGGKIIGRKLYPLEPRLSELAAKITEIIDQASNQWFVVNTEPREEKHVASGLKGSGLLSYCPTMPKEEKHGRGRTRIIERSMFPSYVFAKCEPSPDWWHIITATRGVRRLLSSRATGKPTPIPDGAIEVVKLMETEEAQRSEVRKAGTVWTFTAGEKVRIKHGPFASFYAQLQSAVDSHDRIRAMVDLFGRSSVVELSAHDIEAL